MPVKWHEDNKTCQIYSSVLIKIIYGKAGYNENPQQYVIGIEKHAISEDWHYPQFQNVN